MNEPLIVAISLGPLGMVVGVQLPATFQSPLPVIDHVELPALAAPIRSSRPNVRKSVARRKLVVHTSMVRSFLLLWFPEWSNQSARDQAQHEQRQGRWFGNIGGRIAK